MQENIKQRFNLCDQFLLSERTLNKQQNQLPLCLFRVKNRHTVHRFVPKRRLLVLFTESSVR